MTPSLNPHDRARLANATRALTSPLAAESFEGWLTAVNRSVKELVGADKASFMFPWDGNDVRVCSDEFTPPILVSFACERLPEVERRWNLRTRGIELGVFSRRLLYGEHAAEIYRSEYYGEYLVPHRAFDSIGLSTPLESASKVVNLYFHHDRPTGRRFGARGLALLRVLYPAFQSGVHAARMLFSVRQGLTGLADAVPVALALADASGRMLHQNRELARLRNEDPDWAMVDAEIARACRSHTHVSTVRTRTASYRLSCSAFGGEVTSVAIPAFAVIVDRRGAAQFPACSLTQRFGLTPRELEVTRLLCEGATNQCVAGSLSIRSATARHHTERVMHKLGVHSRAQIPPMVARMSLTDDS